ncbi:MAG: hypothetical protein VW397_07275 [Candidatus Margulisiibacteriota bacterium]
MKTYHSYAKLNLNLYVGPPEVGGLHRLSSIFQTISLFDIITIKPTLSEHSVRFIGMDVPQSNTCTAVLNLLGVRLKTFWDVEIVKNIPDGAGLGGGSSNAATLILALNQLESLNLSMEEMVMIASQVGSDVPYFLYGGQSHVSGTGDKIIPNVSYIDVCDFILILPGIHCSTANVYAALDSMGQFDDVDSSDLGIIGHNRLFEPACNVAEDLALLFHRINTLYPNQVFMSGSGSTLFIPCWSTNEQINIKKVLDTNLGTTGVDLVLTNTVNSFH